MTGLEIEVPQRFPPEIAAKHWPSPNLCTRVNESFWGWGIAVPLKRRSCLRRSRKQLRSGSGTAGGECRGGLISQGTMGAAMIVIESAVSYWLGHQSQFEIIVQPKVAC